MALRRTKSTARDDDELLDDEEEEAEEEEEEEADRGFPRWIKPLLLSVALLIAVGVGGAAGVLWQRNHAKQNDVVATINGQVIDIGYLQHRMDVASGNSVAHAVAQEDLLLQFAKKEGQAPPETDVESRFKEISKDSKFGDELFRTHQNADDIKNSLRLNMARTALLTRNVTVSDMEAQKYYEANVNPANPNAQFFRPETVLISVIVARQKATIDKAADALRNGQPFPTVATTYSEDNSKASGGQLPPIKKGQPGLEKSPELAKIIFGMKAQQTLGPLKIANAYWLIRCTDKQPSITVPFDRARDAALKGMLMYKGQQINGKKTQEDLDAFQATSQIVVRWPNYTDAITAKSTTK